MIKKHGVSGFAKRDVFTRYYWKRALKKPSFAIDRCVDPFDINRTGFSGRVARGEIRSKRTWFGRRAGGGEAGRRGRGIKKFPA